MDVFTSQVLLHTVPVVERSGSLPSATLLSVACHLLTSRESRLQDSLLQICHGTATTRWLLTNQAEGGIPLASRRSRYKQRPGSRPCGTATVQASGQGPLVIFVFKLVAVDSGPVAYAVSALLAYECWELITYTLECIVIMRKMQGVSCNDDSTTPSGLGSNSWS